MERKSGILMHVSSLWGNYMEGDLGRGAIEWIDFLKASGFTYWQVLPFCMPDSVNSPYKSYSAFSLNPNFVSLDLLRDEGLLTEQEISGSIQSTPYTCEFERINSTRVDLLAIASRRCTYHDKIDEFLSNYPQTVNFCKFMALKKANNYSPWQEWIISEFDEEDFKTWKFIQYQFLMQWKWVKKYANDLGIKIIGDIPIYVDLDSSDVYFNPSEFLLTKDLKPEVVAGVPPDYFSEDGQLWGNPIYDWKKMKKSGYKWWKERASFMFDLFDGIRIDHFRAFESYYAIPYGSVNAKNGEWIKGPGYKFIEEIKKINTDKLIIAEDLGVITEKVEKLVKRSKLPGMKVFQFGFMGDTSSVHLPHNYIENSIAYSGTHDNNTLLGFVWEMSDSDRRYMLDYIGYNGYDWNNCYDDIIKTILRSPSRITIFQLQDILKYGSDTRINTPGKKEGNWAFRITKEQVYSLDKDKLMRLNKMYGRI